MGRGNTLYGLEVLFLLHSPPSNTWGEEILCMDWRFYSCFTLHLPTDVDHEARIRRSRSIHCPQEVLLNISTKSQNKARKRTKSRQDTKNFAVPTLIRYCCF